MHPLSPIRNHALPTFAAALMAAAHLCGCLEGTSTESVNTFPPFPGMVKGRAFLSDGSPADSASLSVRSGSVFVTAGIPSWTLSQTVTADSLGFFTVILPPDFRVYLEVREKGRRGGDSAASREAFFARYDVGKARPPYKGTVIRLQASGSLRGRVALRSGDSPDDLWLGVEGTSSMIRLGKAAEGDSGAPFRFEGLAAGAYSLSVIHPDAGPASEYGRRMVADSQAAVVKPGAVTDLPALPYNDD